MDSLGNLYRTLVVVLSFFLTGVGWAVEPISSIHANDSHTEKFRVMWISNPSNEITIAWKQVKGSPGTIHYDVHDFQRRHNLYKHSAEVYRTVQTETTGVTCFVKLGSLKPDTEYYFCIKDDGGVSRRLKFRTAPDKAQPFTFIAGGDSRNHRDVRKELNKVAARLKPLFIAFTGDMVYEATDAHWDKWLEDWQHTIAEDGTVIPILAHRGNHENKRDAVRNVFDTPQDVYYALDIGGDLLRFYVLNSVIPAGGKQKKWLESDLSEHANRSTFLMVGYHHPMRPHVSKKKEGDNSYKWASVFYKYGVDLAFESDSHCIKRTFPLKPSSDGEEGFVAAPNDPQATIYLGEGCWGAPLRRADDAKAWTLDSDAFNGFDWVQVTPTEVNVKTVMLGRKAERATCEEVKERNDFTTPKGLSLWQAEGGEVLTVKAKKKRL